MPPITQESSFYILDELKNNTLEEIYDKIAELRADHKITDEELISIKDSLVNLNQIFLKQEHASFTVRQATLADVDALMDMIEYWAKQGQNLPRKRNDIIRGIQTFAVCVKDSQVMGCACLYVYDSGLAEIRSLGVSPVVQRQGQGRAIVNYLLKRAAKMFIKRVFVLTRSPEFFSKVGFQKTVIEALPEKILKDCENCPKRATCDEVAYIYDVNMENA